MRCSNKINCGPKYVLYTLLSKRPIHFCAKNLIFKNHFAKSVLKLAKRWYRSNLWLQIFSRAEDALVDQYKSHLIQSTLMFIAALCYGWPFSIGMYEKSYFWKHQIYLLIFYVDTHVIIFESVLNKMISPSFHPEVSAPFCANAALLLPISPCVSWSFLFNSYSRPGPYLKREGAARRLLWALRMPAWRRRGGQTVHK